MHLLKELLKDFAFKAVLISAFFNVDDWRSARVIQGDEKCGEAATTFFRKGVDWSECAKLLGEKRVPGDPGSARD
ncbi:hypothetical protein EBO34_15195 [Alteribacter keqinensis]|uniref:Uncharacterized protein n=1 Tax=Alteribacter keqinensis TaxID=2483800 RepID=A0A3M7TRY2_9BACI|nr:hypothetical protein EBO34_15195 [Alteribacter keqinensis]